MHLVVGHGGCLLVDDASGGRSWMAAFLKTHILLVRNHSPPMGDRSQTDHTSATGADPAFLMGGGGGSKIKRAL